MMNAFENALRLAVHAHRDQRDKDGQPYIHHLLRVMLSVGDAIAKQAAVLHDILEDTPTTPDDLVRSGVSPEAIQAIRLLTHSSTDSYSEYVIRLSENDIARRVKLADIEDNYSIGRAAYRIGHEAEDIARLQRYLLTHRFLTSSIDVAEYRARMAAISPTV